MHEENTEELDTGDNSGEYKVEAIQDSAVYARESELDHLPDFYYLVSWKGYPKEEITWEPASTVQHLRKLISLIHKDHLNKLTATSPAIDTVPLVTRPIIKPTVPLKWKRGRLIRRAKKRAK